jgi:hypothetical protein
MTSLNVTVVGEKERASVTTPHAASVDPTHAVAHELLDVHGHRLRHVHLSSLDKDNHHRSLTPADKVRFTPLLDRCRDVPWILEAPPR